MSIGLLSIALGNIFALSQTKVMRLLAYSGIANAGFIFLGIFVSSNSSFYVPAFYIIIYSISSVGIISILSVLSSKGFNIVYINDLKGFVNNSAFLSLSFLIILLSLAGIPFTAGMLLPKGQGVDNRVGKTQLRFSRVRNFYFSVGLCTTLIIREADIPLYET